jgi:hypothetical protein
MPMSNATLVRPEHVTSLATAGRLAVTEVSVWTATKQDRQTSDEITSSKNAAQEAGKFTQYLLANNPIHKKVVNYRQTIYNWVEKNTYPWNGKQVYVPAVTLPKFMSEWVVHEREFYKLVDEFVAEYPNIVSNMAFTQGDLFDRNNYPSSEWVKDRFSVSMYVTTVPLDDFRTQLAGDLADDLHEHYQRQAERNAQARERMVTEIMEKQAEQLLNVMESISRTCDSEIVTADDGTTKVKRRKLYEGTIERALELCSLFRGFNLVDSPKLRDASLALGKLLNGVSADAPAITNVLRDSDGIRAYVKGEVDDILSKFR